MNARVRIDVRKEITQTLIDELMSGKYVLPPFQRQFVWDEDDIKSFIDSLVRNLPIGTIILWKPSTSAASHIAFSKPLLDVQEASHSEVFYVIDGQQRLTSLLLLLNNWEIERGGKKIALEPISYNPANRKFYKSSKIGEPLSTLINAFYHYDGAAISDLKKRTPPQFYKQMEDMIKGILNKYPIPICTMETDHEDEETFREMAEAFIRVNKLGMRIGNLELMLSFLAGAEGGELTEKIRNLHDDLHSKFEIDLQPVIRFAFSNFELKQTQISRVEQFKRNMNGIRKFDSDETSRIFDKSHKAMGLTIDLLRNELGLSNSRLLPSQVPLVPVSAYLYKKRIRSLDKLDGEVVSNILNWFVLVSFNGYYSSQTDTKLDGDLQAIRESSEFPYDELVDNMQRKKARTRITLDDLSRGTRVNVLRSQGRAYLFMLYVLLVRNKADDWNGTLLGQRDFTGLARYHIFPIEFLEERLELEDPEAKEVLLNNLANITFIHKDVNSAIEASPPQEYLPEYANSTKKHFVPHDKALWSVDQYEAFKENRIRRLYTAGKRLFADIFE